MASPTNESAVSATKSQQHSPKKSGGDVFRRLVCGGVAGMIAKTATNPLDRIRMLAQTGEGSTTSSKSGVVALYRDIIQREGIVGLWAGNGANLVRIFPAKAVVFASNDVFQTLVLRLERTLSHTNSTTTTSSVHGRLSAPGSFVAGGLAGMTATLATYPLDLARGRIAGKLAAVQGQKEYGGLVRTLVLTVQDEGVAGLYRGVAPTLLGAMPYEGIKFGTVGVLEQVFPADSQQDNNNNNNMSPAVRKMWFGGAGGVAAAVITYPNDTVRRLLQLQGSRGTNAHYEGYWDCVRQTYRQYGIGRFYAGLGINIIRMAPNAAVQFGSYELLKQWTADWF